MPTIDYRCPMCNPRICPDKSHGACRRHGRHSVDSAVNAVLDRALEGDRLLFPDGVKAARALYERLLRRFS